MLYILHGFLAMQNIGAFHGHHISLHKLSSSRNNPQGSEPYVQN